VVRTIRSDEPMAAGTAAFVWDGRRDDGSWAPEGWYRSIVSARTSLGTYSHERRVFAGAFRITPSTTTPARGGSLTLTIVSTEALAGPPRVEVREPGSSGPRYSTTKVATRTYRVTLTLPSTDATSVEIIVSATDSSGGAQRSTMSLPLR
jgi:hypothetical protein